MPEHLISTVNAIRSSNFRDLPPELVAAILEVEREGFEDRTSVIERVEQLVDAALAPAEESA